jgi:hypothetical protein
MADADKPTPINQQVCRDPTLEDLANLCRALNEAGARYLIVGGFAIRAAGFARNTQDVDLLVETTLENEALVFKALMTLPDQAIREVKPGEVGQYGVVRVADEILVDLMKSGCGVDYAAAIKDAVFREIEGVRIPFASPMTLWRMKQTPRAKDIPDRLFLRQLLEAEGVRLEPPARDDKQPLAWLRRWLVKLLGGKME